MIRKFPWLDVAVRRAQSVAGELVRVRNARRPILESSQERVDPCAQASRCNSFGLLVGASGASR
jgi:hypothetical protein